MFRVLSSPHFTSLNYYSPSPILIPWMLPGLSRADTFIYISRNTPTVVSVFYTYAKTRAEDASLILLKRIAIYFYG